MADLNLPVPGKSKRGSSVARMLRIDMTPMVDLGFLLITFFIFNSVVSKPSAMQLLLPADGPATPFSETRTLTVLLGNNGRTVCYGGFAKEPSSLHIVNLFSDPQALRNIIINQQLVIKQALGKEPSLMVIIKPGLQSNYRQLVAVLDEMTISGIKKYAIADMDEADRKLLPSSH